VSSAEPSYHVPNSVAYSFFSVLNKLECTAAATAEMSIVNEHGRFKHGYPLKASGERTPFVDARSFGDDGDQRWDTNFHNEAATIADRNPPYPMQPLETGHDVAPKAVGATPHAPGYRPLGSER
jgi:hypothetical protein